MRSKKPRKTAGHGGQSAVVRVASRAIRPSVQMSLLVHAGGRCEFDGCNRFLFEHPLTHTQGNFSQMAHIVAFAEDGPRGRHPRPPDVNEVANLMLLCPTCHKLIDDNPETWTREVLREHKVAHEERIHHLTGLAPSRATSVLVLKGRIGGQPVVVPFDQIVAATSPRYPAARHPTLIDLTGFSDKHEAFLASACAEIGERVGDFLRQGGEAERIQHVSLFAYATIPLLVFLGWKLGNKIPLDLYQRHRDTEDWSWKNDSEPVDYRVDLVQEGNPERVAVVLSLSGSVPRGALPDEVRTSATIYELTLAKRQPSTMFLRSSGDLERFRSAYQALVAQIVGNHGLLSSVDLFPAVPLPVAVLCGRELLPKVHPSLRVYDYDKEHGGFTYQLTVN